MFHFLTVGDGDESLLGRHQALKTIHKKNIREIFANFVLKLSVGEVLDHAGRF